MGKIIDRKPVEIHTYERDFDHNIMPHSKAVVKKYHYVAEYEIDNLTYEASSIESCCTFKEIGALVEVCYNPKNPKEAFIEIDDLKELNLKNYFLWLTIFMVGFILIIVGLVFYFL